MKLGLISPTLTRLALLTTVTAALGSTACSFTTSDPLTSAPPGADGGTQPSNAPPHALASISLGESHVSSATSTTTTFTPEVAATFIPDTSQSAQCSQTISGCTIAAPAVCDGTTGPLCQSDQACTLDANCHPICQTLCTAQCPAGQVCYFPSPSTQACQPIQSFNGGDLILSGAGIASPLTLVPPSYALSTTTLTNPLVWGNMITVTSSGATGAGFAAFSETVKATTLLQTTPPIAKLTAQQVFSSQGLSLGWTPGSDAIQITVTGPKGTAQCPATDAVGAFTVPAQVISAVAGAGNPAISLSVARQHTEVKTDGKTQGTLTGETVQPVGYVQLTTTSMETATVEGCPAGEAMCGGACVDVLSSSTNCGACGVSCTTGSYCSQGVCGGSTTCTSPNTLCNGKCVNLMSSASNCGDCGFACPSGESCVEGACTSASTCSTGYTMCSDGCQYLPTSSTDCGSCGNSCDGGTCSSGVCQNSTTTCASCEATAESGTCASAYSTCNGDANCGNFASCMSGCAGSTTCQSTCLADYPTGSTEAQNLQSCICSSACSSSCSTDAYCTTTL
jgi:hypothetical protein